jgi:predicted nucleic acid-binding protein
MIILDASVVVKWFSEEEYTEKALEIRERIRMGEERVIVPDLLLYELANALKYNPSFDVNDVSDALTSILSNEDNNSDNKEAESIVEDAEKFLVRIKEAIKEIQNNIGL